jgi:hypothetical protein
MCKSHKMSHFPKRLKIRGLRVPRRLNRLDDGKV